MYGKGLLRPHSGPKDVRRPYQAPSGRVFFGVLAEMHAGAFRHVDLPLLQKGRKPLRRLRRALDPWGRAPRTKRRVRGSREGSEEHMGERKLDNSMSKTIANIMAAALLVAPGLARDTVGAETVQENTLLQEPHLTAPDEPSPGDDGRGTPYEVDKNDNICGLNEPRTLTRPAKVDYDALLASTSEVAEIKRRKIQKGSADWARLMADARRRVLEACIEARESSGHCSIWKKIARRDGGAIDDLTKDVKALLSGGFPL